MTDLLFEELLEAKKNLELATNTREEYFYEIKIQILKDLIKKVGGGKNNANI